MPEGDALYGFLDQPRCAETAPTRRLLGISCRCQAHFDARVVLVDVFVEVRFDDAVVIDAEAFAEGILCDLEPAIDVSPESRGEIEPDGEGEPLGLELYKQSSLVSGLCQFQPHELSHLGFIGATSRREQASAVHGGILMVHAGRQREG